jgi:SLT domain-containing protein
VAGMRAKTLSSGLVGCLPAVALRPAGRMSTCRALRMAASGAGIALSAGCRSRKSAWADTAPAHGRPAWIVFGGLAEFERASIHARTTMGRWRAGACSVKRRQRPMLLPHQMKATIRRQIARNQLRHQTQYEFIAGKVRGANCVDTEELRSEICQ